MGMFTRLFGGERADVSAATLKPQGVRVIDVRSRGEFQGGHIAGARNLDASAPQFASSIKALDARRTYLVYCQSGGRSARAAGAMRAAGLTVLDGGGIRSMQSNGWTVGP